MIRARIEEVTRGWRFISCGPCATVPRTAVRCRRRSGETSVRTGSNVSFSLHYVCFTLLFELSYGGADVISRETCMAVASCDGADIRTVFCVRWPTGGDGQADADRKSTRLNSSHAN